jgi:hypothetical protein
MDTSIDIGPEKEREVFGVDAPEPEEEVTP